MNVELMLLTDDPPAYDAALERLQQRFPDDPAITFLALGQHGRQQRWTEALAVIDQLDRAVQGPYLDAERARSTAARARRERGVEGVGAVSQDRKRRRSHPSPRPVARRAGSL